MKEGGEFAGEDGDANGSMDGRDLAERKKRVPTFAEWQEYAV